MSEAHRVRVMRQCWKSWSKYLISEDLPGSPRACSVQDCTMTEWYDTLAGRIHHDYYASHTFRPPLSKLRLILPKGSP
jgi:hypothetical protein